MICVDLRLLFCKAAFISGASCRVSKNEIRGLLTILSISEGIPCHHNNQKRIIIAFHPGKERFEVSNAAIQKSQEWIPDITILFDPIQNF